MICIPARLVVCILYTQTRPEYTQTAYQEALPAASGVHSVPWKCLGSASTALSRVPPPLLKAAPVEACSVPQGRPNRAQPSVVGRVETQIIFTQLSSFWHCHRCAFQGPPVRRCASFGPGTGDGNNKLLCLHLDKSQQPLGACCQLEWQQGPLLTKKSGSNIVLPRNLDHISDLKLDNNDCDLRGNLEETQKAPIGRRWTLVEPQSMMALHSSRYWGPCSVEYLW